MPPSRWEFGKVDRKRHHFEIRYGDAFSAGAWKDWLPVALVGPAKSDAFAVQILLDQTRDDYSLVLEKLRKELTFYLVELGEPDPWKYAKYHCGTTANVYSEIHWSFYPSDNVRRRYPERKERELSDQEKEQLRKRLHHKDADICALAEEFHCTSSQVAGIKAAMHR